MMVDTSTKKREGGRERDRERLFYHWGTIVSNNKLRTIYFRARVYTKRTDEHIRIEKRF